MKLRALLLLAACFPAGLLFAQNSGAPVAVPGQFATAGLPVLGEIERAREATALNIARLRIDKWKTDKEYKQQSQSNAESLSRNLTNALPSMLADVQRNPASLQASFKLYRNLNALYDVMAALAESAGAFGPKDEFEPLAQNVQAFDQSRRALADRIEALIATHETQAPRPQSQQAAGTRTAPKRIVVDDTKPAPKPSNRKRTSTPK